MSLKRIFSHSYLIKNFIRAYIKCSTWTRDSNGLFDYQSKHISTKLLKTSTNAKIIRIKNDIHLINDYINEKNMSENSKILAHLNKKKGIFHFSNFKK